MEILWVGNRFHWSDISYSVLFFNAHFTTKHCFQVAGAFIALTAVLGRGGWGIQTASGETVLEKIDRGMFVISELGAIGILLFVLIL